MRTLSDILTCKDTRNLSVLYLSRITDTESLHAKPIEYFNLNNIYLENKTHGTDTESLYTKPIEYFNM
jgi:hypothetical protein